MKFFVGLALLLLIVGASNLTQKKVLAKKYDYAPMSFNSGQSLREVSSSKFTAEELKMEIESALPIDGDKVVNDSPKDKPTK